MKLSNALSLFNGGGIGFDNLLSQLESTVKKSEGQTYPPYNYYHVDNTNEYIIEVAVAGFTESELKVEVENKILRITGEKDTLTKDIPKTFYHKGIGARLFVRSFTLAEHIKLKRAVLSNGILKVVLIEEIPEEQKPVGITIEKI